MPDIITELRERSLRAEQEGEPLALLDDAADEITRLRDALDEQTGRAAWHYDCLTQCEGLVIKRDAEIARLRLTDAEREALWTAAEAYAENDGDPECERIATALHGLWQRMSGSPALSAARQSGTTGHL